MSSGDGSWSDFVDRRAGEPGRDAIGSTAPMPPFTPEPAPPRVVAPRRRAAVGRFVVSLAGLLAAGTVVLGLALLVLVLVVPRLRTGTGINVSTGPGWGRAAWHLGVGIAAEIAMLLARRRSWPAGVTVAGLVVAAVAAVLARAWWI